MKIINYKDLMEQNPMSYGSVLNQIGQTVHFFENPELGDEATIIGVINNTAFDTDFWDTDDFYKDSDYNPILIHKNVISYFELDTIKLTV